MTWRKNILKNFADIKETLFGKLLKTLILYGFYARENYKENPYIDMMILISMSDNRWEN